MTRTNCYLKHHYSLKRVTTDREIQVTCRMQSPWLRAVVAPNGAQGSQLPQLRLGIPVWLPNEVPAAHCRVSTWMGDHL